MQQNQTEITFCKFIMVKSSHFFSLSFRKDLVEVRKIFMLAMFEPHQMIPLITHIFYICQMVYAITVHTLVILTCFAKILFILFVFWFKSLYVARSLKTLNITWYASSYRHQNVSISMLLFGRCVQIVQEVEEKKMYFTHLCGDFCQCVTKVELIYEKCSQAASQPKPHQIK